MATPFVMTVYPDPKQLATPKMNALKCRPSALNFAVIMISIILYCNAHMHADGVYFLILLKLIFL